MINTKNIEYSKLPPQSIEFEEAVLGAIMIESNSFIEICDIIKPDSFYKESHRLIYKAITDVYSQNNPIDFLTVMQQLRANESLEEVGGMAYLTGLTQNIGSASHIEFHARIIQQKFIQRELIRISTEVQQKAFDEVEDIADLLNFAESELFGITQGNLKKEPRHIGEIGKDQLKLLEEVCNSDKEFTGIPTGLTSLDRLMNGLQNKKLIIIAARPAMGKTTLVISLTKNIAINFKKSVAIFTLEMGEDEIWNKLISDITGISYAKIVSGKINSDWENIELAQRKLEEAKIFIDDTAGITLFELRAKARRLKMKHNIDIIFIDYLQLMSGGSKSGNREQEISNISRGLKVMSKDLDIPIVCLSQLNRSVESRPDKKPQLSDLRESGAIEQDADIVAFIYRPEEYGFMDYGDSGESTINKVDILIRKNRGGKTGDVSLDRTTNFTRIYDKSSEYIETIEEIKPIDNTDLNNNLAF